MTTMNLLIENEYKSIEHLGSIKRPYLDISFKIEGHPSPFKYSFRPDTGFVSPKKSGEFQIKSCEGLKEKLGKGVLHTNKRIKFADGSTKKFPEFRGTITEISGTTGSIKPQDMAVTILCMNCSRGCKLDELSKLQRSTFCRMCLKNGRPNVFGFDFMNQWIAEFNGPDQKFSIKEKI